MIDPDICLDATSLHWWYCVKEEAEHVRETERRFRDQIHRGGQLPSRNDRALASLELVFVNQMIVRGQMLFLEIAQRPGFSNYFVVEAGRPGPNPTLQFRKKERAPGGNQIVG